MPRDSANIFPAFKLTFKDQAAKDKLLAEFRERKQTFQNGLDKEDASLVPIYRGENEWLCQECPYISECNVIEVAAGNAAFKPRPKYPVRKKKKA